MNIFSVSPEVQRQLADLLLQHGDRVTRWLSHHPSIISNAPPGCLLRVGDCVSFTNEYGVTFNGRTIVAFTDAGEIVLNTGCFHVPKPLHSVQLDASGIRRQW